MLRVKPVAQLNVLLFFAKPLVIAICAAAVRDMLEFVSSDDPWMVRAMYQIRRRLKTRAQRFAALFLLLFAVCLLFYVLLVFFNWVFELDGTTRFDIEKSAHYSHSPHDARSYVWLVTNDKPNIYSSGSRVSDITGIVSSTVVEARIALRHARHLVLVHNSYCDIENSSVVTCQDAAAFPSSRMTHLQMFHKLMQLQAYRFLAHNYQKRPCVCGPLLGYNFKYMALYTGSKAVNNKHIRADDAAAQPEQQHAVASTDESLSIHDNVSSFLKEIDVDRNTDAIVVHMFNPVDEQEEIYDALDTRQMKEQGIGLDYSLESQNYRYNETRGVFNLLRRTRIRVSYQDEECRWLQPWISGAAAICVQECFDLMRGIDVRERARMQFKHGVVLNDKYFTDDEVIRPSCKAPQKTENTLATTPTRLHHEL